MLDTSWKVKEDKYLKSFTTTIKRIGGIDKNINPEIASKYLLECLKNMNLLIWNIEDSKNPFIKKK